MHFMDSAFSRIFFPADCLMLFALSWSATPPFYSRCACFFFLRVFVASVVVFKDERRKMTGSQSFVESLASPPRASNRRRYFANYFGTTTTSSRPRRKNLNISLPCSEKERERDDSSPGQLDSSNKRQENKFALVSRLSTGNICLNSSGSSQFFPWWLFAFFPFSRAATCSVAMSGGHVGVQEKKP